jgi:tRNA 2-selenouridine synthase
MNLPQIDDYQRLFMQDTPLLDVRAPVEFQQGAFPQAKNVPLINDDERQAIGIRYKEKGQEKAIELGHKLVKGEIKAARVASWVEFTQQHPQGALYCFRGGMRSKISQRWIFEKTGVVYPRIKGGYKALRRYLLNELEIAAEQMRFLILSGRTGTGKTLLLNHIVQKIDLEDIYRHRGSAFGKYPLPQPSQIDIENKLSIALLKHHHNAVNKLILEDEGAYIGSRRLPECMVQAMRYAPLIFLEADIETRVDIVFNEYITNALNDYQTMLGESQGFDTWAINLQKALDKIQRRLGGQRYKAMKAVLEDAIQRHRTAGETEHHKTWIQGLLVYYYDPMYDYQLEKKSERVIFRGEDAEVLEYINQRFLEGNIENQ